MGCEIALPPCCDTAAPQRLFQCPPRGLPVRRALLLQEATLVCKAMSHNSALLATDDPTPCADAATCFHEHFQDFPWGLHNWAGCWILGNCAEGWGGEGEGRGHRYHTAFNIGGQRKVGRIFTCARDANKTLLIVYHFSLSFILPSSV